MANKITLHWLLFKEYLKNTLASFHGCVCVAPQNEVKLFLSSFSLFRRPLKIAESPLWFSMVFYCCYYFFVTFKQFSPSKGKKKALNSSNLNISPWRQNDQVDTSFWLKSVLWVLQHYLLFISDKRDGWKMNTINSVPVHSFFPVVFILLNHIAWPGLFQLWEFCQCWIPFTLIPKASYPVFHSSLDFSRCCLLMCLSS